MSSVDTLVVSGNNNPLDMEALRAIYGSGVTMRVANNAQQLVAIVNSYNPIGCLVIATHGSEGDVVIRGVHTSIKKIADLIRGAPVRSMVRREVIFDGCNIGGESASLVAFLDAVSSPKLIAFAASRLWWYDDYAIPKGTTDRDLAVLRKRYDFYRPYLVAGQPSFESLAERNGHMRIWYEGFSRTERRRPESESDTREIVPRSKLQVKRVSRNNLAAVSGATSRPAGPMILVEILRS